jgi:hypothetical protein
MPKSVPDDPEIVTDEQIGRAIQKGSEYLCSQFGPLAHPDSIVAQPGDDPCYTAGRDALAVYALLQCSLAIDDPRLNIKRPEVAALIDALKRYKLDVGRYQTYSHGLRATALAVFNRPEDRDVLRYDAQWLIDNCDGGAYTYAYAAPNDNTPPPPPPPPPPSDGGPSLNDEVSKILGRGPAAPAAQPAAMPDTPPAPLKGRMFAPRPEGTWDNSNSQYGLLGVWAAAEAGFEVPDLYWAVVEKHWTDCQVGDGNWSYEPGMQDGYLAMTCAGLASLLVTHDYLEPAEMGGGGVGVGRDPYSPPVRRALDWFERGHDAMLIKPSGNMYDRATYTLFGLERVGLASGFKHFGANDWYKLIARHLVDGQRNNGSWGDGVIDTSYSLLCLARGRHPIVMTKLRFDGNVPFGPAPHLKPAAALGATTMAASDVPWVGYWANRPRDAANLARFAGKQLEHQLNWQVVNIERNWTEWNDGPVLELASHTMPHFTEQDLDKLRNFVEAGGLLFTQADGGSEEFNLYAVKLAHDLFPRYKLLDVPPNHPIYTHDTVYNIDPRPLLKMVSNGSRILMLHSPTDITRFWQQRDDIRHRNAFHLGVNLFVYAAGKRDLRNRLQTTWVTAPNAISLATVKLARVSYDGNWGPEPLAWTRFSNWLQRQTGTRIETQTTAIDDLKTLDPAQVPIAHLTGTDAVKFLAPDAAAVRAYVRAGGVLLIDTCGGPSPFVESADALLAAAFPDAAPQVLQANHPLLLAGNPGTQDVSQRRLRQDTALRLGRTAGNLHIVACGKGHVLIAPLDITSGLLGTNTTGILGYDPAYTQALVKNLVFWTLDGQAEVSAVPAVPRR